MSVRDRVAVGAAAFGVIAVVAATTAVAARFGDEAVGEPRSRYASGDREQPELGRKTPPPHVQERLAGRDGRQRGERVSEADLLARSEGASGTLLAVGHRAQDGSFCVYEYVEETGGFSGTCAGDAALDASGFADLGRSAGVAGAGTVSGFAPRGTKDIRLQAEDGTSTTVQAFAAGQRWAGHSYFLAPLAPSGSVRVIARDAQGKVLAEQTLGPVVQ